MAREERQDAQLTMLGGGLVGVLAGWRCLSYYVSHLNDAVVLSRRYEYLLDHLHHARAVAGNGKSRPIPRDRHCAN